MNYTEKIVSVFLVYFNVHLFSEILYSNKDFAVISLTNKGIILQLYRQERQTRKMIVASFMGIWKLCLLYFRKKIDLHVPGSAHSQTSPVPER